MSMDAKRQMSEQQALSQRRNCACEAVSLKLAANSSAHHQRCDAQTRRVPSWLELARFFGKLRRSSHLPASLPALLKVAVARLPWAYSTVTTEERPRNRKKTIYPGHDWFAPACPPCPLPLPGRAPWGAWTSRVHMPRPRYTAPDMFSG